MRAPALVALLASASSCGLFGPSPQDAAMSFDRGVLAPTEETYALICADDQAALSYEDFAAGARQSLVEQVPFSAQIAEILERDATAQREVVSFASAEGVTDVAEVVVRVATADGDVLRETPYTVRQGTAGWCVSTGWAKAGAAEAPSPAPAIPDPPEPEIPDPPVPDPPEPVDAE